jgi:hypothetical protein
MKKQVNLKVYSIFFYFLKKKVKNKLSEFKELGYQIESIKYFNNEWLIPTAECILFKIGKPCGCSSHYPNSRMVHCRPCCEDGFIFD